MGVEINTKNFLINLKKMGCLKKCGSVMELGSQDDEERGNEVFKILKNNNHAQISMNVLNGRACTGGGDYFIVKEQVLTREDVRVSTNEFYKTLGFSSYDCIDLDGAYNALKFNLNVNFANVYNFTEQFSLVTNFGTTEHVLNQGTCFENVHNLCLKGGVMVHGLPVYGYLNHGFFTYSLKFFI